ncbi:MAG: hypothetical protein RLZZ324_1026 [Candidatus Parcubacteria bacterium]|jgi:regulator of protease activity HflC (stomatin/prohibitin superfamily)
MAFPTKRIVAALLAVFALMTFFGAFTIINAGERGVVLTWGAISGGALGEGLHVIIPFVQRVEKIDVTTQKLETKDSEAYSKDLQVVTIHSVLNWNVDPGAANEVYRTLQGGAEVLESRIVAPDLEVAIKQVIARYTAEELLAQRGKVQDEIQQAVRDVVGPDHAIVTHYALVNESFSDAFEQSIERKQIAEQDALTSKNKLEQVKFEAEQRVTEAQAEAEAIKIQAAAITQQGGANYVQLKAVEKWNGTLPTYMTGGASVPFLDVVK